MISSSNQPLVHKLLLIAPVEVVFTCYLHFINVLTMEQSWKKGSKELRFEGEAQTLEKVTGHEVIGGDSPVLS